MIQLDPFPHVVIPDVLPCSLYNDIVGKLPESDMWQKLGPNLKLREGSASSFPQHINKSWTEYYGLFEALDALLLYRFNLVLNEYLAKLYTRGLLVRELTASDLKLGSAVFVERKASWRIEPHIHDLTQVIQAMLYMPHKGASKENGTILYRLKGSKIVDSSNLFLTFDHNNGARYACMTCTEDEVESAVMLPYEPNTLVAFLNTPNTIHASPPTTERRRYAFSSCVMPNGVGKSCGDIDLGAW
jgi:hypothetical protein